MGIVSAGRLEPAEQISVFRTSARSATNGSKRVLLFKKRYSKRNNFIANKVEGNCWDTILAREQTARMPG